MKKKLRIVIIADTAKVEYLYRTMSLCFGRENVKYSYQPQNLFGLLKSFRPTTLILEPDLFESCGIGPKDINAYRKEMRYHILALYSTEKSLECRERYEALNPDKEYIMPQEYLTMAEELPALSINPYTRRKRLLQDRTRENLDRIFRECGFLFESKGAPFLKEALYMMYFDPTLHDRGASKIYRDLAEKHETTPRIVERSILRFLENSWSPQTEKALRTELNISDHHSFVPLNFGRFTEIFNTYYTIKYGDPEKILRSR